MEERAGYARGDGDEVVLDSGDGGFGKMEAPLMINAYEAKDFAISGVAFSKIFTKTTDANANLDAVLLEGRSPRHRIGRQVRGLHGAVYRGPR